MGYAVLIQDQLRKVGAQVDLEALQINAAVQRQLDRNFDAVMHGFTSSQDPTSPYLVYSSKGNPDVAPHQGGNETRISIPEMDSAWETIVHTLDTQKIKDAYATIQDIYSSDQNTFELPFFNHVNVWLLNPKLHNMVGNPTTSEADWNTEDWWIEK